MAAINTSLAAELGVAEWQVKAAVDLLDGGATVPFIARYRKEVTGTLDDAQLRTLEERLAYLRDLEERRAAVLEAIEAQGKLDAGLKARILAADTKARLEDLYLPFKVKRRTKAQIAREAGLDPLAEALLARPDQAPEGAARAYVDAGKGVADVEAALEGARAILIERFSEDPELVGSLRESGWQRGRMVATVKPARPRPARSSRTISTSRKPSRSCPRTASSPCSAARRRRCSTSPSPMRWATRRPRASPDRRSCASPRPSASATRAGRATPS